MVQLVLHGTQARLDIAQAFSVGKLGEGHTKELIKAREGFHVMIPAVTIDAPVKLAHREEVHQLGKHQSS
jgi:hypothetical protein